MSKISALHILNVFFLLLFIGCWLLITPLPAQAVEILPPCIADGNCQLSDFLQLFVNLAKLMLGVLGSVALLFFVIGGTIWLTAAGSQDRIGRGKKILSGAVIGIIIVLGAWTLINFIILGLIPKGSPYAHLRTKWWKIENTSTPSVAVLKKRGTPCSDSSECQSTVCWQHFKIKNFGNGNLGVCVEPNTRNLKQSCVPLYENSECREGKKCNDAALSPADDCDTKIECGACI